MAFFSPTDPRSPLLIEVMSDSKILPSLISNLVPVVCSRISCPKAPNLLVLGSIKVNVPIPTMLSLTYNPVL